jgi:hypothetical protein
MKLEGIQGSERGTARQGNESMKTLHSSKLQTLNAIGFRKDE